MNLTIADVNKRAARLADVISNALSHKDVINLYGVPRGGIPVAYAIAAQLSEVFRVVDSPDEADVIVDDIVDSGATRAKFEGKPFWALIDKNHEFIADWIVFPWEGSADAGIRDHVIRILQFIGGDSSDPEFEVNVDRVTKSFMQIRESVDSTRG